MQSQMELSGSTRKRSDYVKAMSLWRSMKTGLSQPSKDWMLAVMDGFHDGPLARTPLPSGTPDKVVVETVTRALDIGKPTSIAAGTKWDLIVVTNPFYGGESLSPAGTTASTLNGFPAQTLSGPGNISSGVINIASNQAATSGSFHLNSAILCVRVPTGTNPFIAGTLLPNDQVGGIDIPTEFLRGEHRIVSEGVEVVNTTNALTVNGSVTNFTSPSNPVMNHSEVSNTITLVAGAPVAGTSVSVRGIAAGTTTGIDGTVIPTVIPEGSVEYCQVARPPINIGEAEQSQDSLLWHAKFGTYFNTIWSSIPQFQRLRPRLTGVSPNSVTVQTPSFPTLLADFRYPGRQYSGETFVGALQEGTFNAYPPATAAGNVKCVFQLPHVGLKDAPRKGAWFTGLDDSATFHVRARWRVERKPILEDGQVYALAETAPPEDPLLWEAYSAAVKHIPIACMVDENPLGEWMNMVAKAVAKYAPKVGNAVNNFIPGAQAAGGALGTVASIIEKATQKAAARAVEESDAYRAKVLGLQPIPVNREVANFSKKKRKRKKGKNQKKGGFGNIPATGYG